MVKNLKNILDNLLFPESDYYYVKVLKLKDKRIKEKGWKPEYKIKMQAFSSMWINL